MDTPRVVITGIGIVCSMGRTVEEYGRSLFDGGTCIGPLEGFEIADKRYSLGGQYRDFDFQQEMPAVDGKRLMRFTQFSMVAADRAITDAALNLEQVNRNRIGTSFSTTVAGLGEVVEQDARRYFARGDRGISPAMWSEFTPCACTTHVAIHFGFHGPTATHSDGCVSSMDAIVWGVNQLRLGSADAVVIGGGDTMFTPFLWAAICRSGILAQDPGDGGRIPRPFSHDHNGIALVEGGSALVLETEQHARLRRARIYGEIAGVASVEEALPLTELDPSGHAYAMAMQRSLQDAGLPPTAIDWVCAHGTGYPGADCAESRGIETALGPHVFNIPVSSIRGAVGQSFASGGGFQVAAACLAIRHQRVPPTLNFSSPAEGCRLDYVPNQARIARVRHVIINTAGVGGTHTGVVIAAC